MRSIILAAAALAAAAPATAADFTGARIEGRIGYDRLGAKLSFDGDSASGHRDGAAFGVGVGYDFPLGKSLVLGVEGDVDFFTTKSCDDDFGSCLKARRDFEASARLGTKVGEHALLYVKGGYANGQLRLTQDGFSATASRGGYRVGAGAQFAVTEHVYVKAEYRYTRYGSDELDGIRLRFDRNQVIGAVGFRF